MMKYLTTPEIRDKFKGYFEKWGHQILASSSLLPIGDSSLFFTNAGMVPFKEFFLGRQSEFTRVATVQRCLRASGKHNDLANVGYTTRHHTFFEMLGNFSFGDYFKKDAIHLAWQFLTEELEIAAERLWITVHAQDEEAEQLWREEFACSGKKAQGISKCGDHDNFWSMGEVGPCGYCSEIFYDHGSELAGKPPGLGAEGERYVEIWNLVFMQFNRDSCKQLATLPKPSIDTGMGLERIAAVLQGVHDNYDIDLFLALRGALMEQLKLHLNLIFKAEENPFNLASRVVSDHIRSAVFLIADGVFPANDGKGYVLRSIVRRATYYLYTLGIRQAFFYRLAPILIALMQDVYPETDLLGKQERIMGCLEGEEKRFLETLERGVNILEKELQKQGCREISGAQAFKLHDTYGMPFILTQEIAQARGLAVDIEGFNIAMEQQKELSRAQVAGRELKIVLPTSLPVTRFVGYQQTGAKGEVIQLYRLSDWEPVNQLETGAEGVVILNQTPFYGEGGGQRGDCGYLTQQGAKFLVMDTQKQAGIYLHYGKNIQGIFKTGEEVEAQVDIVVRQATSVNHSATHLLHMSLREVLGEQATQQGSYVGDKRLRFDFVHHQPLTSELLVEIERRVNGYIRRNLPVNTLITDIEEAKRLGAMALFGEKYDRQVRMVQIGTNSKELCGGTHISRTGEIVLFKILKEENIAAGVRRIEAVTGEEALNRLLQGEKVLRAVHTLLGGGSIEQLPCLVKELLSAQTEQNRQLSQITELWFKERVKGIVEHAPKVQDYRLIFTEVEKIDLKRAMDLIKERIREGIIILYSLRGGKFRILVGVTNGLAKVCPANQVLRCIFQIVGGRGGGKAELAEGGGDKAEEFVAALPILQEKTLQGLVEL